jgi:plastocyanin
MHKGLLAAVMVAILAACGSDKSTGPDGNPNPNPQNRVITINGSSYTPNPITALVGDTITWTVASTDHTNHKIHFYDLPSGVSQNDTDQITAGQSVFTIFLQTGTYKYYDVNLTTPGDTVGGTLIINPLS